ncbi:thrombin-like enzyme gyroxin B2.1 [Oreochromis niloticus]|uniref:Thrombin-like enzyme gyroxin B2.1 n=1 Tax=Oreochromis niloticus TaxID=8128 RepID=I3JKB2_ORENI|nr:thrombin-like enzyme gyroxin B2.1 [Oreochromis niloticus]XP_025760767.1 thrombin-like enzyme gyroxin B2.1 [Oreochromis niloticus]
MRTMAHLKHLLLLLWVGVTVSSVVNLHKRIFNGSTCEKEERHYHVKLIGKNKKGSYLCGGSLIHKNWVLTAAHCGGDGSTIEAFLGIHQGPVKVVKVKTQNIFYTKILKFIESKKDIMLLKLDTPSDITPVDLPDCANPPELKETVRVAGYGEYTLDKKTGKTTADIPATLQCANMHVDKCACPIDSFCFFWPSSSRMCLREPNVDVCSGDSGGGVIYNNKIYGVIVGGDERVCRAPAIALKVCSYIDWIHKTIQT